MAIKLKDLAEKMGVEVLAIRDYILFLDLDIPEDAEEVSEEQAKLLEGVMKTIASKLQ